MKKLILILLFNFIIAEIPERRVIAEWEPALGTLIRWPLGIPSDLVVELAEDDILYVLVENNNQANSAQNTFNNWGVNLQNVEFIFTDTFSHWTRDHGPEFLIGEDHFEVINQQFWGYPVEQGCTEDDEPSECDEDMLLTDCIGTDFCNDQPEYADEGYDCYVNNDLCEDFNDDGQVMDWLGDGYCDDGAWGLNFLCEEYSFDCGDCSTEIIDPNGYCGDGLMLGNRTQYSDRPFPTYQSRGWEEDDDTNIDFADQMNWDMLDIPLYWTGGNFMTDGYGMGFSTELMVHENDLDEDSFFDIMDEYLHFSQYHIFDNPNEESIQHIDCLAKLVNPETIIIKQVPESSPEYECMEAFAESFYDLNTFYDRPFRIHRLYCPEINGGPWELNAVAAYTNSLILNNKVLVPQYGIGADQLAIDTFREAMPGYDVIGFDGAANNPWYSEDALHCRTKGVFDPHMIHISHKSIRTEELPENSGITLTAEIVDYSLEDSENISVTTFWKYESDNSFSNSFVLEPNAENIYSGNFPNLNSNALIEYFITASNGMGQSVSHPNFGWHTFSTPENDLGDVDGNGDINVIDIIFVVNIILGNQPSNGSADVNQDGTIDILDIINIVNIILDS